MKHIKIATALVICVAIVVALTLSKWDAISIRYEWYKSKPDATVRNAVSVLSAADVSYVELKTPLLPTMVRDRTTIAMLLNGLKKARLPNPVVKNRTDTIILILKTGKKLGPFYYSLNREVDSFSPEFVSGLRSAGIKVPREGS